MTLPACIAPFAFSVLHIVDTSTYTQMIRIDTTGCITGMEYFHSGLDGALK